MARQRFNRTHRVSSLLREVLSEVMLGSVKDPRAAQATMTEVEITPDLREARVYVHISGDDQERREVLAALNSAAGYIRREVGQRIRLRTTPTIEFRYDGSIEYGSRIEQRLRELGLGQSVSAEDDDDLQDDIDDADPGPDGV